MRGTERRGLGDAVGPCPPLQRPPRPQHSWSPGWLQVSKAAVSASVKLENWRTLYLASSGEDVARRPCARGVRSLGLGLTVMDGCQEALVGRKGSRVRQGDTWPALGFWVLLPLWDSQGWRRDRAACPSVPKVTLIWDISSLGRDSSGEAKRGDRRCGQVPPMGLLTGRSPPEAGCCGSQGAPAATAPKCTAGRLGTECSRVFQHCVGLIILPWPVPGGQCYGLCRGAVGQVLGHSHLPRPRLEALLNADTLPCLAGFWQVGRSRGTGLPAAPAPHPALS